MRSIIVFSIAFCLLMAPLASAATSSNETNQTTSEQKGKGLLEAINHVPSFVADKLRYMYGLFSSGLSGIGKSLSDWIHTFFNPVVSKGNETVGNNTA